MRFVVIGFAHPHIDGAVAGFRALRGVELVGIADADPERLADRQKKLGTPAYGDYRQMLDALQPDFAAVCPANADKAAVICACAEHGVHVFADKPLLTRMPDLLRVEAAVRAAGIEAWAFLELRYNAPFYTLKQQVAAGQIGTVVSIYAAGPHRLNLPTRTPEMLNAGRNGGVLVDLGCHDLDLARWLTGDEPQLVMASHSNRRFTHVANFNDNAQAFFRFQGGATAYLEESWLQPDASRSGGDRRLHVVGSTGTLEYCAGDNTLTLVTVSKSEQLLTPEDAPTTILADFVATIRGGGSGLLNTAETLASMRGILWAHEAAVSGQCRVCR
ncbi:MAG TPA: Gfo/Idh/MocA family oxidoreductase [Armatimonadota bacterium]|nr:Gfo/Idh/MocA family oxidoreductase [Armatimonadota bacterium]